MPDKKLTDSEIKKALECCANCESCDFEITDCPLGEEMECRSLLAKYALDLINRLQAENERLKTEKDNLIKNYRECQVDNLKKFAERLNHIFWHEEDRVIRKVINNLLKELVGE